MHVSTLSKIQQDLSRLSDAEREQLAPPAWNSLGDGSDPAVNQQLDPEGVDLALRRDREIESGHTTAISKDEFLRRIHRD